MSDDEMFGVRFIRNDGHDLELVDDFTFSMLVACEAWAQQRRKHEDFNAVFEPKIDSTHLIFPMTRPGIT